MAPEHHPEITQEQAERFYLNLIKIWCRHNGVELESVRFESCADAYMEFKTEKN